MHPPISALLQALDVQLAEEEAFVVRSVGWWLRHCGAALRWRRSRPSCRHVSCFSGSRPTPRFRPVPSSRPVRTGRLLWNTIGKTGDFTPGLGLDTEMESGKSWKNVLFKLLIVIFKPGPDWVFFAVCFK